MLPAMVPAPGRDGATRSGHSHDDTDAGTHDDVQRHCEASKVPEGGGAEGVASTEGQERAVTSAPGAQRP